MGIQEAFIALAKDKDIRGRTRSVLDYLFGKLGFENYILVTQQEISNELEIAKTHISSSIKILLAKGIILPGPKLARTNTYRLNSQYGWKGKVKNLAQERIKTSKERMEELNLKVHENTQEQSKEIKKKK